VYQDITFKMEYVLKMMITVLNTNILTQQRDGLQFGVVAVKKYVNHVNLDFILILPINVFAYLHIALMPTLQELVLIVYQIIRL